MGYDKEEVIGRDFSEFLTDDSRMRFPINFSRFKKMGEVRGVEFEMVKSSGKAILVSFDGNVS
jgi:PAS domain S-box-containing protein